MLFTTRQISEYPTGLKSEIDIGIGDVESENYGRTQDEADMARMGKQQQTRRNFGLTSMLGFTTTMMCTWEGTLPLFTIAYQDGGSVAVLYGYIFAFIGSLATCASLAELASMYPTSGGQYHWVAILAPPKWSKSLSWLTGWVCCLGWQAATTVCAYLGAIILQGLFVLNHPTYVSQRWHGTLLLYAVLLITLFVNTVMVKYLPALEGLILILHILLFFAILIPVVHLGPISSPSFVFTSFVSSSGYSSDGLSWLVSLAASSILFVGYDGACHMAEEVQYASLNVPRSMIFTMLLNGTMGFAILIVILFCIGDVESVMNTPTGWPFIQLLYNAIGSKAATTILTSLLCSMFIFATFGFLAATSRQTWAFARDRGLPFSDKFAQINPRFVIPLYAIGLTTAFVALLALINIGSTTAFNAIVSLVLAGFFSSYLIAICFLIRKRLLGEHIPFGPWRLGRFGLPINIFAVCYLLLSTFFSFFPPKVPVTAATMNWSALVYAVVVLSGIAYYAARGRHNYKGPIMDRQFAR